MTTFTWDARVDGDNIAGIILDTGSVTDGRTTVFDQPQLPVAVIDLLTIDASATAAALWPDFSLGDHSQPSGFVDVYASTYTGVRSRVTIGAPVVITARTPSAFTDEYIADYVGGVDSVRFAGKVQAIDYTPDVVRLTCLPVSEGWARIEVGGTDGTTPIPQEADTVRVQRLCDEAGVDIVIDGGTGPDVIAIPVNTAPSGLLAQLQDIATSCRALFYTARDGTVHYRTQSRAYADHIAYDAHYPYSYSIGV
jgi:hypothetical protein